MEESMTDNQNPDQKIIVYGTSWCGDTRRALRWLDQNQVVYEWVDIDKDMEARKFVEKTNRGYRSVPTILFPDGSLLVEPSTVELEAKFGMLKNVSASAA
jgi:mycoredoxin